MSKNTDSSLDKALRGNGYSAGNSSYYNKDTQKEVYTDGNYWREKGSNSWNKHSNSKQAG